MTSVAPLLSAGDEYPVPLTEVPSTPMWCENFALVANDPARARGIWVHFSRQAWDLSLYRETILISLSEDQILVLKDLGRGGTQYGPGGATCRLQCEDVGQRWRLTGHGSGRVVSIGDLTDTPVTDGPLSEFDLDLVFEAAGSPWIMGGADIANVWEKSHYEQLGRIHGSITVAGEAMPFEGTGNRDHSRGPRDFTSVRDHVWSSCLFPDGRFFAFYVVRSTESAPTVAVGFLGDSTETSPVTVELAMLCESADISRYTFALRHKNGVETIEAEVFPFATMSFLSPNDMVIGRSLHPAARQVVQEARARFTWGQTTGWGHSERSTASADWPIYLERLHQAQGQHHRHSH